MAAVRSAMHIAKDVTAAGQRQDWAAALAFVDEGESKWPNASLPSQATWARLRAAISKRAGLVSASSEPVVSPEPVAQADPAPVAESSPEVADESVPQPATETAPETGPEVSPEPVPVAASGLTITHSVAEGTNIHGTSKGDGVNSVLRGLRAGWSWYGVKKVWYIKGAKGGGADMPRILAAKRALESAGFRVTLGRINNVDPETGGEVKPKLSNAELLRRARRRSAAMNQINWNLTMSGMPCECGCGETVRLRQSKIVDGPNTGMPMVFLDGHQPGGVREVPASPVVVPAEQGEDVQEVRDVERADTVVYPADREFAAEARAAQGELVRQWVGPQPGYGEHYGRRWSALKEIDTKPHTQAAPVESVSQPESVEVEPTVEPVLPVPVGEFRKCVGCGQDDVLHSAEGRPWPHNKLDGVACRSMGRVVEDVEPEPAPVRRKRTDERKPAAAGKSKVSARKAVPVLPEVFDLATGARPRQTATEVRRRINSEVAPKLRGLGGEFEAHVYVDKSARTLRVTFAVADEFRQAAGLMLAGVVMATPGVAVPVAA